MTSTINASTTAGIVTTADTSGVLALQTAGTTAVTVDASQIVGIGITPSAWGSGSKALQMSGGPALFGTSNNGVLANNIYYDGTNYRYVATSGASLYLSSTSGANILYSAPSGTAGNVVTFTQVFAVQKDQSLALQGTSPAAGTGITFPAVFNGSSDINTLDDYEEGTFTPTFTTSSGALGSTSNVSGAYTKVGNLVTLSISFQITNIGTAAGAGVNILSLPFNGVANRFAGVSREIAVSGTGGTVYFNGATSLSLNTAVAGSPVGTNNYWLTSISYFTT